MAWSDVACLSVSAEEQKTYIIHCHTCGLSDQVALGVGQEKQGLTAPYFSLTDVKPIPVAGHTSGTLLTRLGARPPESTLPCDSVFPSPAS